MYAVVGCGECSHLWLLEGRSETTECPRCGQRKPIEARRTFVETDDADHAREVRASMLANRQGHGDAFADLDTYADLEAQVEEGVVSDEEYLEASGIDVDAVTEAGERDPGGSARRGSRRELVEAAVAALDRPTEEAVVDHVAEQGVSSQAARKTLEKLVRSGAVSESGGRYRLL